MWWCGETTTVEHADVPISRFDVPVHADLTHLRRVTHPRLFDDPFASPQPPLWPADAVERHPVRRAPPGAPRRRRYEPVVQLVQLPLLGVGRG